MTVAREGAGSSERASRRCSYPDCRVPASMLVYRDAEGNPACISHAANQSAKQQATSRGGARTRDRLMLRMPEGTPDPDWSSPKAIRAYLSDRAGRIERGELDPKAVPVKLAELAKATHDSEALEKLGELEQLIRARLGSA